MKFCKVQGQSDYFSGIWIVKDAALWYAVHRADRSAEVRGITTQKKRGIWDLSKQQWAPRHGEQGQVLRQLRHSPAVRERASDGYAPAEDESENAPRQQRQFPRNNIQPSVKGAAPL